MKKLMMTMVLGAALALQGALKDELPGDYGLKVDLTSATQPGTPLKNNTIYTVRGHVLINAKANVGMSALKVPIGVSAIIEIPKDCSLPVNDDGRTICVVEFKYGKVRNAKGGVRGSRRFGQR